jgi:hypothetical protein
LGMGHYKLLFLAGMSLSMANVTPQTLAAASAGPATSPALTKQTLPEQAASEAPAQQLQALVAPLIHYPDHMVSAVFAASAKPEQVALAARYLNSPSSIEGDPNFDQATLTLMQYPALVNYMAANLVWVSELGQMLAANEHGQLWAALANERLMPKAALEPIHVVSTKQYVTHRSRPIHTSARRSAHAYSTFTHHADRPIRHYRVKHSYIAPPRHQRIWWDTMFYDPHFARHGSHHRFKHWQFGASYGHPPRHFSHHRGGIDDFLFRHQRALERRIHRQHRAHVHREHNRQHRREHRQEHRQGRRQERRGHHDANLRPTPKREAPRAWMFAEGPLR